MIANFSPLAAEFMARGKCESCPIIDMHGHFGPLGGGYLPWTTVESMCRSMDRAGVSHLVLSSHEALFGDPDLGNAVTQSAIDARPERFFGYWLVNPNYPASIERLSGEFEAARGFVGLKLLPDYHARAVTDDAYRPALEYANEKRLPVLVHTWGGSANDSPQVVERAAERYPQARFLMGHSGFGDWGNSVRVARDYPNVYLELTAVYVAHDWGMLPGGNISSTSLMSCLEVNGVIEYMVEHASSKKVIYGTDLPWYSPHFAAGAVIFAHIDDEARHDILHRNAERLLGIH